jgi:predicted NAD/FAD-binding protein
MTSPLVPETIAVIGGGVAGLSAAFLLQEKFKVTLFERNDYVGGHTHTILIPSGPDAGTPVDTGFIVLNDRTYPTFHRFLQRLGVPVRASDMSFGFYDERTGLQYAGSDLNGLFAQRSNIFKPAFYRMLWDIGRFGKEGLEDLKKGATAPTLGKYLESKRFSKAMIDHYLLPMGSSIWSTPPGEIWEFPTETFLSFFNNHGLLDLSNRPQWQTVVGGGQTYVHAFLKAFRGEVRKSIGATSIRREKNGVVLRKGTHEEKFDKVVMATHADEALKLLEDPSEDEQRLLGSWRYQDNHTILHSDVSVLPPHRRAWASWNYVSEKDAPAGGKTSLTYHMNRLQGLKTQKQYCVTLNRSVRPREEETLGEFLYHHPSYGLASVKSQSELPRLNGVRNTYFCGSYFGYGFHEDAVKAGVAVGRSLGVEL